MPTKILTVEQHFYFLLVGWIPETIIILVMHIDIDYNWLEYMWLLCGDMHSFNIV